MVWVPGKEWSGGAKGVTLSPSAEVLTRVLHVFLPSEGTAGEADNSIPGEGLTWTQVWEEGLGELFWDKKVGTLWCLWQ